MWSSQSAWLCTARSSLWSKSSELADDAQSCRRRRRCRLHHLRRSPVFPALLRRYHRHRPSRCWSASAWSCGLSPAGPGSYTQTRFFSSQLSCFLFALMRCLPPPLRCSLPQLLTPVSLPVSLCTCLSLFPLEVCELWTPVLLYLRERYTYTQHKVT